MTIKKKLMGLFNRVMGNAMKAPREPYVLSMLGITIVAKSRFGKLIFLSIVPILAVNVAAFTDSLEHQASDIFRHLTKISEMSGMVFC